MVNANLKILIISLVVLAPIYFAIALQEVSGSWTVSVTDNAFDYFAEQLQKKGIDKNEAASIVMQNYIEEQYSLKLTEDITGPLYRANNDQLELVLDSCTNLELQNRTAMGEDNWYLATVEQVENTLEVKLSNRQFAQVENFILCAEGLT